MTGELKPCPFCGGEAKVWNGEVHCRSCKAEGASCETERQAIDAWNTRAPDATLQATVKRQAAEIARKDAALRKIADCDYAVEVIAGGVEVEWDDESPFDIARQALGDHNG